MEKIQEKEVKAKPIKKCMIKCHYCSSKDLILRDEIIGSNSIFFRVFLCKKCDKIFLEE